MRAKATDAVTPLIQPAPDAVVLAGFQCPVEACGAHVAASADRFGLLGLIDRWAGGAGREKEFGVLVEAGGFGSPAHVVRQRESFFLH